MDQVDLIERGARFFASRTAVVCGERRLTFSQVNERANRLANALLGLGLRPGERVATLRHNCLEHVEMHFALLKAGLVEVALNSRLSPQELAWQLNHCQASLLIFQESFLPVVMGLRPQLEGIRQFVCIGDPQGEALSYDDLLEKGRDAPTGVTHRPTDLAEIRYTSGTTGRPKGAMLPRRVGMAITRNFLMDLFPQLRAGDVFTAVQPLYHGPYYFVLPCWVRGVTQVICQRNDIDYVLDLVQREGVTVIKTVPTILVRLFAHPQVRERKGNTVHTIIYGAAPMPVDRLKEGIDLFGPAFVQIYGQTEAPMTITLLRKEEHTPEGEPREVRRLASAGRPFTMVRTRVVREDGGEIEPGETGEVLVQGDHIMDGYWREPDLTREALREGWIYTGDLGTVDEEGYLYLLERRHDMIISGGLNIYPNEVEQVLYQHPAVLECAVIGVPDPDLGEAVKACVVLKEGREATAEELIDFCRERLASYKKPRSVDFVKELPKNAVGKILRSELKKRYRPAG